MLNKEINKLLNVQREWGREEEESLCSCDEGPDRSLFIKSVLTFDISLINRGNAWRRLVCFSHFLLNCQPSKNPKAGSFQQV